jgi:hypothetical protein
MYTNSNTIILEMNWETIQKEKRKEEFKKVFGLSLSLILGISLAVSSMVAIIIFGVFYISTLLA